MADPFDAIVADVAAELADIGVDAVSAARDRLSTPATTAAGPKGGRRVVGSARGQNPRLRTGTLRGSVRSEVSADGDRSSLCVTADAAYAAHLERDLGRPVLSDTGDAFADAVPDRVAAAIRGHNPT